MLAVGGMEKPPPAAHSPTAQPPALDDAASEAERSAYVESCKDLMSAIGSLEAAMVSFVGKEEGVRGQVFAKTKARLEQELGQSTRS